MATLYVENIPDDLYAALRKQAKLRRKSIAQEVISLLEANVSDPAGVAAPARTASKSASDERPESPGLRTFSVHRRNAARGSRPLSLLVLDASVAAKWFLPRSGEPLAEEALALLRRYADGEIELTVPDLFWAEFGNILWKASERAGCRKRRRPKPSLRCCTMVFPR